MDLRVTSDQLWRVYALGEECRLTSYFDGDHWVEGVTRILGAAAAQQIEVACWDAKPVRLIVEAAPELVEWAYSL